MRDMKTQRGTGRFAKLTMAGVVGLGASALFLASPAAADTQSVSFSGGCGLLGLAPSSKASSKSETIEAGQIIKVQNGLGTSAIPYVNDHPVTVDSHNVTVRSGDSLSLRFTSGPAQLTLRPTCGLSLLPSYDAVSITVTPAQQNPAPGGSSGGTSDQGSQPGGSGAGSAPGAPAGGTGGSSAQQGQTKVPDPVARGGVPGAEAQGKQPGGGTALGGPATAPMTPEEETAVAVDPVNAPTDNGPSTLLALLAAVCLIGVGAAAVRTVIAQRSARAAAF